MQVSASSRSRSADSSTRASNQPAEQATSRLFAALAAAPVETGQTPKHVIWARNKARLYHYAPAVERHYRVPLLLLYALINRPYVLDLVPGNSFVEFLVGQGFDVYLLDWAVPGDEDQDLAFDDYIFDYIPRAVARVRRAAGSDAISLLGYCMGGTMAAMYAALFPDAGVRNLILLSAPIDFSPDALGSMGMWTNAQHFDPDRLVDAFGNVPGELIDAGLRALRPDPNYVRTSVSKWHRMLAGSSLATWQAMNQWVNDVVPFPGAAFRQWIRDFYQQNLLTNGRMTLRGRAIDLAQISCSLLTIAGKQDHICPVPQAEAIMRLVSSQDKQLCVLAGGHVGLLTGSQAQQRLWPAVDKWLAARSS